jgi:hypothetical protein
MRYRHESTYRALVGPVGKKRKIWVECLFADHVADLAILGSPDDQELGEEADAYNAFVEPIKPMTIRQHSKRPDFRKRGPLMDALAGSAMVIP